MGPKCDKTCNPSVPKSFSSKKISIRVSYQVTTNFKLLYKSAPHSTYQKWSVKDLYLRQGGGCPGSKRSRGESPLATSWPERCSPFVTQISVLLSGTRFCKKTERKIRNMK